MTAWIRYAACMLAGSLALLYPTFAQEIIAFGDLSFVADAVKDDIHHIPFVIMAKNAWAIDPLALFAF